MLSTSKLKTVCLCGLLLVMSAATLFSRKKERIAPVNATLLTQVNGFAAIIAKMQAGMPEKELQTLFLQARLAYKQFEWAAEYFVPTTTRAVNGAPVEEAELSGQIFQPEGLQVIEGLLFPHVQDRTSLQHYLELLQAQCPAYTSYFAHIDVAGWQVLDASKLEVYRVLTLGITGFDNPLTLHSMQECAVALTAVRNILAHYNTNLGPSFDAAIHYLQQHPDFNSFNRARFITLFGNPLSAGITRHQQQQVKYNRLLNQEAATLFDKNAFNADAFAMAETNPAKVVLGRRLFYDARLSGDGTRSCATCHQPAKAFTDGLVRNTVLGDTVLLLRNTPTLLNAALQPAQFYDLRANTLEEQVMDVLSNPKEMHGDVHAIIPYLDTAYRSLFNQAYPGEAIDTTNMANALAAFVRSLTALNSRFDAYMRGDSTAMSRTEIRGFNLFMGKAKCGTCHYMPLFNGVLPPKYLRMETEVISVPYAPGVQEADADPGRGAIVDRAAYQHAFKTTTVRNARLTAPYMHNGVFVNLQQVIDFYDKGGQRLDNQTLAPQPLHLNKKEKKDLEAFIGSLDSEQTEFRQNHHLPL